MGINAPRRADDERERRGVLLHPAHLSERGEKSTALRGIANVVGNVVDVREATRVDVSSDVLQRLQCWIELSSGARKSDFWKPTLVDVV